MSIPVEALISGVLPWAVEHATQLWWHEIFPSWPSLIAVVPAWFGYRFNRHKNPRAWLFMFAANSMLVVTAFVAHQWGLLIAAPLAKEALTNYVVWRREERAKARAASGKALAA